MTRTRRLAPTRPRLLGITALRIATGATTGGDLPFTASPTRRRGTRPGARVPYGPREKPEPDRSDQAPGRLRAETI
ncbi:hypothetical protein ACFQX6_17570 [Streptosporangium lutulentum]